MTAKVVKISTDGGSNYYTLPGNTGEFKDDVGVLDDTIFGQNFKSGQSNLINWSVTANALYKGFAGYMVDIKQSGSGTSFTNEAMTHVSGKIYQITSTTKNVWDRTGTFVFTDDDGDIAADKILTIDHLFGIVTFINTFTPNGNVVADGKYFPMTVLAKYKSFTLTQTVSAIDTTDIPTAQGNSGHMTHSYGLKTVTLDVSGVYSSSNGYRDALIARSELIIEINPDSNELSVARGFFKPSTRSQKGNLGALEEESASFVLFVPDDATVITPFKWVHTASTLSMGVQKLLDAFIAETTVKVKYLSDGTNGLSGDAILTDISLTGGLEAMNEFSVTLTGTGAVTAVP